jgi:SNF2 family DNA or RNA helicase
MPRVLVCQTQAAGEGLDKLKRANRVYLAEPSWTPKDNDQAIARAARRGQTKPVHASYVSLADSLDDRITGTLMRKRRDIAQIL